MQGNKHKIVVGISGSSGAIYAKVLLDKLRIYQDQIKEVGIVMSDNAKDIWSFELENTEYLNYPFKIYAKQDFSAPFASGSAQFTSMIICPCSMGTLGRVAQGISNDLMTRAADVMLKERKKLVMVLRDTPYSLIHINNMKMVTEAGGIICPATPSFYSKPATFEDMASTVVDRVLDLIGLEIKKAYRWNTPN